MKSDFIIITMNNTWSHLTIITMLVLPMMTSASDTNPIFSASLMNDWSLVSDQVMGGRSSGRFSLKTSQPPPCLHLQGTVTTENNGGFLQIAHNLSDTERFKVSSAQGIRLLVRGNNETYNVHLRTSDMWLPWQSFRSSFKASHEWQQLSLPFDQFNSYKTIKKLNTSKLKRIGIVAIGRDFEADICIAAIEFY